VAPRRRYTKSQKAQAVAAATLTSVEAAAASTGIPRTTIDYWMDRPEFVELRQKSREAVADEMWTAVQIGVREVVKGLSGDAPLRDKATAVGILYDKHALLMGMATTRSESRDLTGTLADGDLISAVREAEQIAGDRRAQAADPVEAEAEGLRSVPD
jgi:hypothetical protein